MLNSASPYEILEVPSIASSSEIQASYRRLAFRWHPDRNQGNEISDRRMVQINEAYELLADPCRRKQLDERLALSSVNVSMPESLYPSGCRIPLDVLERLRTRYPGKDIDVLNAVWLYSKLTGQALPGTPGAEVSHWDRRFPESPESALVGKVGDGIRTGMGILKYIFGANAKKTSALNRSQTMPGRDRMGRFKKES